MRPDILNPLFSSVGTLPGVGPKTAKAFDRMVVPTGVDRAAIVGDVLFHLPTGLIDRSRRTLIMQAPPNAIVTLEVRVDRHRAPPAGNRRVPYRVYVQDDSGELSLVFFHAHKDWLEKQLPIGAVRHVSGRIEWFGGAAQMVHPDHIVSEEDAASLPLIEPVYPLTEGVSLKVAQKAAKGAMELVPAMPEWIDPGVLARQNWPGFGEALATLHVPAGPGATEPTSPARCRLAYDEILAGQIALALVRANLRRSAGRPRVAEGAMKRRILAAFRHPLTGAQERTIAEIEADLAKPTRMVRLVQGDVGAGKTIVGLAAAASVIETGSQAAMMAPTELLARQHHRSIAPLAEKAGMTVAILTGRERGKERDGVLARAADGSLDLLIGTHALFQEDVVFRDLGLAIVDEQHRFGVQQRLALSAKGRGTDLLVMTATPIPRTLLLTWFGDMDVSRLDEKPPGRQPIATRALPLERLDEVVARIRAAVAMEGAKAYWVCPLVEESDVSELAAAEQRYAALAKIFGPTVGLVHGRMKPAEKDAVMARFQSGEVRVLVSTTVVEVGVDVPDATIMVIEHAENFGLAQLHQLRGRVGRGSAPSTCLLLYKGPLGETARARLDVMRRTEDGFVIAEEDLKLRGGGEVLGTRQSGTPGFRIADPAVHGDLIAMARDEAAYTLAKDPDLSGERGPALKTLLYLFERDEAVRLIRAG
jgi:ATP-dependent DNA helicase RecG